LISPRAFATIRRHDVQSSFVLQLLRFPSSQQLSRNHTPSTGWDAHALTFVLLPLNPKSFLKNATKAIIPITTNFLPARIMGRSHLNSPNFAAATVPPRIKAASPNSETLSVEGLKSVYMFPGLNSTIARTLGILSLISGKLLMDATAFS